MPAPKFACHACKEPITEDAPHAIVNIKPETETNGITFAYFCACVGDLEDHAGLREKYMQSEQKSDKKKQAKA